MTTLLLLWTNGVFRRAVVASEGSTEKYEVYSWANGEK